MSYENTPHACFKFTAGTSGEVTEPVPRLLERQLRRQFDSVWLANSRFVLPMVAMLDSGAHSFPLVLGKSKDRVGEWVLIVGAPENPGPLARLRRQKASPNVAEVRRVCTILHELLGGIAGVSGLRWYFEGARAQSPAVATPAELPWE